jgi:hypothetical protein
MTLSLSKLQELIASFGFVANKYFTYEKTCFLVEIFSLENAEEFLLYIPSKYSIKVPESRDSHALKLIEVDESFLPDKDEFAERINFAPEKGKVSKHLESHYKHTITLDKIPEEDMSSLRETLRQLSRIRLSVDHIAYKVSIFFKNYLSLIRRDNTIECYTVSHFPSVKSNKIYIIVDLETFYAGKEQIFSNIRTIKSSIYTIFEKNQGTNILAFEKILDNGKNIVSLPLIAHQKKLLYETNIGKLEGMLAEATSREKTLVNELNEVDKTYQLNGIQDELSRIHKKTSIEKTIHKLIEMKLQIVKNLIEARNIRDNIVLEIDRILFDNSVMLDTIILNLERLQSVLK